MRRASRYTAPRPRRFGSGRSCGAPLDRNERTERIRFVAHDSPAVAAAEVHTADEYPLPGSRLLHFEIVEELGRGAFARVYLARQESLANRLVALKVTLIWTTEPQTLAKLRHTNVIPVYSVHEAGAVPGGVHAVPRACHAGPRPPRHAGRAAGERRALFGLLPGARTHELNRATYADACLWLIGQLAAGLGHAHRAGTLHRDLKPGNVLLTDDGTPMLLDFNVASDADDGAIAASSVGGTFPYMAPEHLRAFAGEGSTIDARSDLFSLGVMLYQMLTLELPFPYVTLPSKQETVRRHIAVQSVPPVPANVRNPAVTPAGAAIVAKLLDRDPACRYQSAAELSEDIGRHLANRPLRFAPEPSVRERARKWRRRNPRLATALAVGAAALLLLVLPVSAAAVRHSRMAARADEVQRAEARLAADETLAVLRTAAIELGSRNDPAMRERGLRARARKRSGTRSPTPRHGASARVPTPRRLPPRRGSGRARRGADSAHPRRSRGRRLLARRGRSRAALERRGRPAVPRGRPAARHRPTQERTGRAARRPQPATPAPAPTNVRDTDLLFDAYDFAATDRYADALPLLAKFCERHPAHSRAWYWRGVCHNVLGQSADAATAFSVCLAVVPDFAYALANRGQARLKQKRFAEAEADYTRALELRPTGAWRSSTAGSRARAARTSRARRPTSPRRSRTRPRRRRRTSCARASAASTRTRTGPPPTAPKA